ncbi:hypothetical protein BT93_H2189 [Corymbia citriodora subsp. variegata]|nr:hypothetical protein BT93_H2189 [Corymbia citriodora subsp. variegata]
MRQQISGLFSFSFLGRWLSAFLLLFNGCPSVRVVGEIEEGRGEEECMGGFPAESLFACSSVDSTRISGKSGRLTFPLVAFVPIMLAFGVVKFSVS